jgi:peptidoglycan/LPS O-acetylase OafA/YrhL
MRGIAALLVCSDHSRHIFFVEYHSLAGKVFFLPYLITSTGHQAVVIFFVLSGFLVGGSVLRSLDQNRWGWKRYLTHRFVRLWLVLIPTLLLCLGWDTLGSYLQHHGHTPTALLHGMPGIVPDEPIEQRLDLQPNATPAIFLGNVFFVQKILVPTFGSNGPLWSLANEFWYYLLFPFAVLAIRSRYSVLTRVLFAAAFLLVAWFVGASIMSLFPIWVFGALLIYVRPPRCGFAWRVVATVVYSAVLLGCVPIARRNETVADYVLAVATTAYLWLLLSAMERSSKKAGEALARGLARFSYTLYLVHMPLLLFLGGLLVHDSRWLPSPVTLSLGFLFWCVALAYAWIVAAATEFRVDKVKKWAEVHIARLPDAA